MANRAWTRRDFLAAAATIGAATGCAGPTPAATRPNVLLCLSDDQSHPHVSILGSRFVRTPAFDRVAREGVLCCNAFAASPGCGPSRAALLTGRHTWRLENAGTHASSFPARYLVFPDSLEAAGYWVGYTGKPWGPGKWEDERPRNPAGPAFNDRETDAPYEGVRATDYAANFDDFLAKRPAGRPFCFWYGASEPHRVFEKDSWKRTDKSLDDAEVPPFLPDRPEVRGDLLDYAVEIEHFDRHLGRMLDKLAEIGELDNTLIIVSSDNGMAFPRAKANCYEYGAHVPLAIRWGERAPGGRVVDDLIGFVDLTATILEAARVERPGPKVLDGRSLLPLLESTAEGVIEPERDAVYFARERHSSSRYNNWTYPQRALRTERFLYIRNFKPDRWPAGDPQKYDAPGELGPPHGGYHDIDACPTLTYLIEHRRDPEIEPMFLAAVDKRPAEELFDVQADPGCLDNLAGKPEFEETRERLSARLNGYLAETGDPRATGEGDVWESYRRYSPIREFPEPPERLPA